MSSCVHIVVYLANALRFPSRTRLRCISRCLCFSRMSVTCSGTKQHVTNRHVRFLCFRNYVKVQQRRSSRHVFVLVGSNPTAVANVEPVLAVTAGGVAEKPMYVERSPKQGSLQAVVTVDVSQAALFRVLGNKLPKRRGSRFFG